MNQFSLPHEVVMFMTTFTDAGYQIYVVGGSVRDMLLGKKVLNWDFTTNAKPEEIQTLFPHNFYNNQFGTVGIPQVVDGREDVFEVTTYRKESDYTNKRHPDAVEWSDTLDEDLKRRDFTINAMAFDGKTVVDPFGGQEDLKKKMIRAVGDPDVRFAEDALRLMRGVRLCAQLGFLLDDTTRDSMRKNAALMKHISGERVRDELFKILSSENPAEGILFLRSTGLLEQILPELDVCFEVPQKSPKRHHIYDVGTHLVMSLKNCPSTDVITRFATLIHDIGKAKTFRKDPETELITFYNHEVAGANQAKHIAKRLRLSNKQADKLLVLVRQHQFTVSEIQTDKAVRRFITQVGKEYLQDMLDLRTADRIGSGSTPTSWRFDLFKKRIEEVQHEPFSVKDLKINGNDVMQLLSIKPGPEIGKILDAIFAQVEDSKLKNEREALLAAVSEYAKTLPSS
jgi:tRNA nucleotidyltransferase (CCA-adding enzyme)